MIFYFFIIIFRSPGSPVGALGGPLEIKTKVLSQESEKVIISKDVMQQMCSKGDKVNIGKDLKQKWGFWERPERSMDLREGLQGALELFGAKP